MVLEEKVKVDVKELLCHIKDHLATGSHRVNLTLYLLEKST
jgi:hypothetical protein